MNRVMLLHTQSTIILYTELEKLQIAKVTFRLTQGHWQSCKLKPLWLCLYLAPFPRYYHSLPQNL